MAQALKSSYNSGQFIGEWRVGDTWEPRMELKIHRSPGQVAQPTSLEHHCLTHARDKKSITSFDQQLYRLKGNH